MAVNQYDNGFENPTNIAQDMGGSTPGVVVQDHGQTTPRGGYSNNNNGGNSNNQGGGGGGGGTIPNFWKTFFTKNAVPIVQGAVALIEGNKKNSSGPVTPETVPTDIGTPPVNPFNGSLAGLLQAMMQPNTQPVNNVIPVATSSSSSMPLIFILIGLAIIGYMIYKKYHKKGGEE